MLPCSGGRCGRIIVRSASAQTGGNGGPASINSALLGLAVGEGRWGWQLENSIEYTTLVLQLRPHPLK